MQANFLDLNLLPEQRPRKQRAGPSGWLGWALVIFAVATLLPLWRLQATGKARVQDLQRTLDFVREQVRHTDDLMAERDLLERSLEETAAQTAQLEREKAVLSTSQSQVSDRMSAVLEALPPRARLEGISQKDRTTEIRGWAGSSSLVLSYARSLQELQIFHSVNVVSLGRRAGDPLPTAVTFVIELEE